ncbi:MAG: YraN family protein [Demequina sp.]
MAVKDEVGRYGEDVAARHVERQGWQVLARNWRCRHGELDMIAMDGTELVAVEVKTRRSATFGTPAEAVTRQKVWRLRKLLAAWLRTQEERYASVRIDVVAVTMAQAGAPQIEHVRGIQ